METRKYNPVGWFEIYVQDMDRAKKFYEAVFQTQLISLSDPNDNTMKMEAFPFTEDNLSGANGSLVQAEGVASGGNSVIIYFSSADCSIEESRVAEAGGQIIQPKMSIGPHGFMTLCLDTEGNTIGIHSMQ